MKNWLKKIEHPPVENEPCKNCGTVFSGHYCPECGQSEREINRPFSIVFYDFLGNIFAIDTRFWKTFVNLVSRPGFLTKEFFAGHRVRYAPPMRFFIFASFILFLLLQVYSNRGLNSLMYSSFEDENNPIKLDSTSVQVADSVLRQTENDVNEEISSTIEDSIPGINLDIDMDALRGAENFKDGLDILAVQMEKKLEDETDPGKRAKLIEHINLARSPQMAITRMLKYMSWAFFLLLPVFALILKLFYIRRYYIRHLIFSIHLHSFMFVIFILIILLIMFFESGIGSIILFLLLTIPVYFIIALKKFYGQNIGKVVLKFLGISFLYNIIFGVAVGLVFLNALSII